MIKKLAQNNYLPYMFILQDLILVVLHIWLGSEKGIFNLDWERNIPSLYQAFKLILTGAIFISTGIIYYYFIEKKQKSSVLFYILGLFVILLGLDEAAEIHEALPFYFEQLFPNFTRGLTSLLLNNGYTSSIWIIYGIIIALALTYPAFLFMRKITQVWNQAELSKLGLIFLLFFGSAVGFELISTTTTVFFSSSYGAFLVLEEMLEMIAVSLLLVFAIKQLQADTRKVT